MTVVDIDAVRDWLGRLPGGSLAGRYIDGWVAFEKLDRPVVTLFGSYDTGKSSLLRRLIVDSGGDVPSWLTISARHETFEVNDVEVGGCIIRDTPGFAVGASDIRAQNNSRRAMAAVGLTDVGIAVLTPQLATAERDVLQKLFAHGWPAGTTWFVISRFDEAGVDPEYDLAQYRELGDRKVRELREQLELDDRTPVFVVSQDPFQTAGQDTDLGRETWDDFRGWDGIQDLAAAVEAVSSSALPGWRHAAGQRYWTAILDETVTELRRQLSDYTARAEVAASGVARRDAWASELETLDRAALAGLDGLVEEVLRRSWEPGSGTGELQAEIQRTLDAWFTKHEVRLQRLQQSIRKTKERERARPSWAGFASLVATLGSGEDAATPPAGPGGAAEHVETVGTMLIGMLKAANKAAGPTAGGKASSAKAPRDLGRPIGIAEAALPLAVYLVNVIDKQRADRARLNQDKTAAEMLQQVVTECTQRAHDAWKPFVDDVRATIVAETRDQVDLDKSLRRLVEQLHAAVAEGEGLLRGGTVQLLEAQA
ncbi:GTPase domain-containing protein [Dactylosporangium sp. NPDC049742]|uniref:GTPase domain-containing protein n=1 Tax=Dactylosporangium sp. NPDC049742 TaxID=3154737 RepID=UPI00343AD9B5